MKQKLLAELLKELREQIAVVCPHQDSEIDCMAHENAIALVSYLTKWAEGEADLRIIKNHYKKTKNDLKNAEDYDET